MHFARILSCGKDTLVNGIERRMEYNCKTIPGSSGGPVINQCGMVIGIVKGRVTHPDSWTQTNLSDGASSQLFLFNNI